MISRASRFNQIRKNQPVPSIGLSLEPLEERQMLTTWSVSADAVDGAEDSLRAAISAANINGESDTINLAAVSYTHLTLPTKA